MKRKRLPKQLKFSDIQAAEVTAHSEAARRGMRLDANYHGRVGKIVHWMLNDAETGARVLDYWPARGRWRTPTGESGVLADPTLIVEIAARLACKSAKS